MAWKLCKRGHEYEGGKCGACYKLAQQRYRQSAHGKAVKRAGYARLYEKTLGLRAKNYGMTADALRGMLTSQGDSCAICREPLSFAIGAPNAAHVDHDHATGAVRGLLCRHCNSGLGLFVDSADRLEAAAAYLRRR